MNTNTLRQRGMLTLAVILLIVLLLTAACGVESGGTRTGDNGDQTDEFAIHAIEDRPEISAWTRPNGEFSYAEFVDAGWKQYQIYDVDTLPNALEARYGFFNRKDVEIRRYASHEDAMNYGVPSAQEALDRVVHDGSGFASRRVYGGFLVVGDLVMMCEVSTDDCVALVESVESTSNGQ